MGDDERAVLALSGRDGTTPFRPRKRADVLELDMGDGVILYDHDSSLVHHLNPSASIVWQLCDGGATASQLAAEIAEELELEVGEVVTQVDDVIRELEVLGLIESG